MKKNSIIREMESGDVQTCYHDAINIRPELYLYYLDCLMQLLAGNQKITVAIERRNEIIEIFKNILSIEIQESKPVRYDAIFLFEMAYRKNIDAKKYNIAIPVKEPKTALVGVMPDNLLQIINYLGDYLLKRGGYELSKKYTEKDIPEKGGKVTITINKK